MAPVRSQDRSPSEYERSAEAFFEKVQKLGLHVSPAYRKFILEEHQHNGTSLWFDLCLDGQYADDHIMTAAMSEMKFPSGVAVMPLHSAAALKGISERSGSARSIVIKDMGSTLRSRFGNARNLTLLVPVNYRNHWGVIIAEVNEKAEGAVHWADGLFWGPPPGIMETTAEVLRNVRNATSWRLECENFFNGNSESNQIGFSPRWEKQGDGYCCGFYVLALISLFATEIGCLPGSSYRVYNRGIAEGYRDACTTVLVNTFHELQNHLEQENEAVDDMKIMRFLNSKIICATPGCNVPAPRDAPHIITVLSQNSCSSSCNSLPPLGSFQPIATQGFADLDNSKEIQMEFADVKESNPPDSSAEIARAEDDSESVKNSESMILKNKTSTGSPLKKAKEILITQGAENIISIIMELQTTGENFSPNYSKDYTAVKNGYVHQTFLNCMEKKSAKCACSIRACLTPYLLWDIWKVNDHCHPPIIDRRRKDETWFRKYFATSVRPKQMLLKVNVVEGNASKKRNLDIVPRGGTPYTCLRVNVPTLIPTFRKSILNRTNGFRNGGPYANQARPGLAAEVSGFEINPVPASSNPALYGIAREKSYVPGAEDHLKMSIEKYVEVSQFKLCHTEVVAGIHHICESFGFPVTCLNARYTRANDIRTKAGAARKCRRTKAELSTEFLLYAQFVCSKSDLTHTLYCPFRFILNRSASDENMGSLQEYVIVAHNWSHSHEAELACIRKALPHAATQKALVLSENCHLRAAEIVRILEDTYNFTIDKKSLINSLNYHKSKTYPIQRDAAALLENLRKMKCDYPSMYYDVQIDEFRRLKNICLALPLWKQDYYTNGIVPGVSIDAKALACAYDIPLVTINGRDNNGKILTFFMGYIAAETEQCFAWFLQRFKKCYNVALKFVCADQHMACLNAVKTVLPTSLILLDQYHLNINQLKSCMKITDRDNYGFPASGNESSANQELHCLRNSPTEQISFQRRSVFEQKYLSKFNGKGVWVEGRVIPKWFYNVYYSLKNMVIACYTRKTGGLRSIKCKLPTSNHGPESKIFSSPD